MVARYSLKVDGTFEVVRNHKIFDFAGNLSISIDSALGCSIAYPGGRGHGYQDHESDPLIHSLILYRNAVFILLWRIHIDSQLPTDVVIKTHNWCQMWFLIADPKRAKRRRFVSFGSASTAKHPRPQAQLFNIADDCRYAGNAWWHAPSPTVRRR